MYYKIILLISLYTLLLNEAKSQRIQDLENANGFRGFKFGMTSEDINQLRVFYIPPKEKHYIAGEYKNDNVTYVSFFDLEKFPVLKNTGYAYYFNKPIKYIAFLFYNNKLFKIRLHFFENYPDSDSYLLRRTNQMFDIDTDYENGQSFGNLESLNVKYEGISESDGATTTISFEKKYVTNLIEDKLPFSDDNLKKYRVPKTYALLVGVEDYSKCPVKLSKLPYCDSDVERFRLYLKSPFGGNIDDTNIIALVDSQATKSNILNKAKELFYKSNSNDKIIFYFSGHGFIDCFFCYDDFLYHSDISTIIRKSKAKVKLCIADACFAGSWDNVSLNRKGLSPDEMINLYGQTLLSADEGVILFTAARGNQVSFVDDDYKNSIFTYYILDCLTNNRADQDRNHIITIEELYNYTKVNVNMRAMSKYSRAQEPQLRGKFDLETPIGICP